MKDRAHPSSCRLIALTSISSGSFSSTSINTSEKSNVHKHSDSVRVTPNLKLPDLVMPGDRAEIRDRSTTLAMHLLRRLLLGEDFLSLVDVEFDLEHNVVRLFQAENCEGKKLAHWASDGQSVGDVPIDPLIAAHPQIVLDVAIDGKTISALLDTGAASSALDKPAASRLGATPETPGVTVVGQKPGVGDKTLTVWSAPFQSFTIGTESAKDVRLPFYEIFRGANYASLGSHIPTKAEGAQQMLLGVDFLRSHRVLVSHSQKRMYFTHNGGPMFASSRPADAKGDVSPGADGKPPAPAN
jgi:hypothetical protein